MAFNIREFFKGLLISEENTNSPKQIQITPGGTSNTKTTLTSSQTSNQTITLPDDTTTLLGTATTQNVSNKTITNSTIDSTPIGQTVPAAVTTTSLVATTADINGGTIDNTVIGDTTPAAGTFTDLVADTLMLGGSTVVTEDAVQTLSNKSLVDNTTHIIDSVDPTIHLDFDAAGTTATKTTLTSSQTVDRVLTLPDATDTLVGRNTTDTLTNKTLTTPTITNPDIDGGSVDNVVIGANTPAAADFTTVDTTSDLNVGGNVVITGDLTVNGTTTTLNTQTLDVEDSNITVNVNGNDVSAEGAGLTVDRTGTSGSLIYKDASATKFAAGSLGSEVDLVGTSSTQTLSNKSLVDANTTIVDSVDATKQIKFDASGTTGTSTTLLSSQTTNKILTLPDATDTLVGKNTTDLLTNKTLQFLQQAVSTNAVLTGSSQTLNTITTGIVRLTNPSLVSISGITAGASGQTLMVENKTGVSVNIFNEDTGTTSADRILTGTAATVEMKADSTLIFIYDTTSSRWHLAGGSGSGTGGSGSGGVNFIPTGNAESTNPFVLYTYGATAKPVVPGLAGAGGITATISSVAPLADDNSFLLTKTVSANTQGASYDIPFTVDPAYRAKAITIEFDYILLSGTFQVGSPTQDSELIVYIYDIDNNLMIEPSNYKFLSNSTTVSSLFSAQFQTSSNSINYRLMFYSGTTNANQYSMKVDNIKVGPSEYVYGTPVTDWQTYTPTFEGFGTVTQHVVRWRRVGDSMEIQGTWLNGTVTAATAKVSIPSGYSIKNYSVPGSITVCGVYGDQGAAGSQYPLIFADNDVTKLQFGNSNFASSLAGTSLATNGYVSISALVPIAGWSSSVQMSDSADTRVVMARFGSGTADLATAAATNINFPSVTYDTHSAYSAGTYKIPVSGFYRFSANDLVGSSTTQINIFKNGSFLGNLVFYIATGPIAFGSYEDQFVAGDLITFQTPAAENILYVAGTTGYRFKIGVERITGPSAIAATEMIVVKATNASTQSFTSGAPVATVTNWTEVYDSHGAFNPTTGIFTAPAAGTYSFRVALTFTNTLAAGDRLVRIVANGVDVAENIVQNVASSGSGLTTMITFTQERLLAGQTVEIRAAQNSGATQSLNGAGFRNILTINRDGILN